MSRNIEDVESGAQDFGTQVQSWGDSEGGSKTRRMTLVRTAWFGAFGLRFRT